MFDESTLTIDENNNIFLYYLGSMTSGIGYQKFSIRSEDEGLAYPSADFFNTMLNDESFLKRIVIIDIYSDSGNQKLYFANIIKGLFSQIVFTNYPKKTKTISLILRGNEITSLDSTNVIVEEYSSPILMPDKFTYPPIIANPEEMKLYEAIDEDGYNNYTIWLNEISNTGNVLLNTKNKFLDKNLLLDFKNLRGAVLINNDPEFEKEFCLNIKGKYEIDIDLSESLPSLEDEDYYGHIKLKDGEGRPIFSDHVGIYQEKNVLARPSSVTSGDKIIEVIPDEIYDAMEKVNITVPLQFKSATITPTSFDNGNISVTPNAGKLLSSVTVIKPTETKTITENGTGIDVAGYGQVDVNVSSAPSLPSGFTAIATGKHTLSSAVKYSSSFDVTHNLGVVPDMFVFWTPTNIATTYSMLYTARSSQFQWNGNSNLCIYHGTSTTTSSYSNPTSSYGIKELTNTKATITSIGDRYYWRAGTYNWMAIKF